MQQKGNVMKKIISTFLVVISLLALYSCAQGVEIEISFIADGEVYDTVKTGRGEIINIPEDPTMYGYTFDGWYFDEGEWREPFTAGALLDTPISSEMKLSVYAKWVINMAEHKICECNPYADVTITVTFMGKGSELHNGNTFKYKVVVGEETIADFKSDDLGDNYNTYTLSARIKAKQLINSGYEINATASSNYGYEDYMVKNYVITFSFDFD